MKKTKTVLFASLIAAMILPFSVMDFADAKTEEEQTRVDEKLSDIEDNQKAYQKLVEQATQLEDSIAQLEEEYATAPDSEKMNQLHDLGKELERTYEEMDVLQEINYELFSIPEDKLTTLITAKDNVEKSLSQNDLLDSYIDYKTEELVFIQNPDSLQLLNSSATIQAEKNLDDKIKANANGQEYRLESIEDKKGSTCKARSNNCDPAMGGLKVKTSTASGSYGTLGFAADRSGKDGFVITSHQTNDQTGGTVYQYSATVGTVTDIQDTSCDCAFVENTSSKSTQDKIWISSYGRFSITDYASSDSDHNAGTFLRKSGVASGVTSGSIYSVSTATHNVYTDIYSVKGDSGSPIYAGSGSSGKLYGLLTSGPASNPTDTIYTKYHIVDKYLSLD